MDGCVAEEGRLSQMGVPVRVYACGECVVEKVVCGGDMSISAQATSGPGNLVRLLSHC